MKKTNGVITYYWNKEGKPQGIKDKISMALYKKNLFEAHDRWTIEKDGESEPVGAFYHITGPTILVKFLEWLTDIHFGKKHSVKLETDENGQFTEAKDL